MARAKGKRNRRKEKLEFVQDYLPIRDLKNGIIETTDDRYIKILEIEPINFTLRSDEEQFNIISSFASWLKISPMRLQFKSITRRADSDKHISMICEELEHEENPQCKELGEDYIGLIKDVGNREALTRRFFLIFQYEAVGRNESDDYAKIYGMLQTAEQTARAYFMQCGNSIIQSKDPDEATAEILYMFYNRRSCTDEPFSSRVDRIVVDTMAAKKKIIGMDPVPPIRMANFLASRGIDLSHYNYVVMDGLYYSFLYIKAGGYPSRVRAGWMSSLINAGEGVDIDVHLRRENRSRTIDKVAQRIRLNRTKLKSMQDTSTDYEELTNSIQAGYFIKNGIANYKEILEIKPPLQADGIILGEKNGSVVCLPKDTRLNRHIAVFGASGTRKSRGVIRPALFTILKRGESAVITDPKAELYNDTAELFRKNGYEVKVFNLVDPRHGDSWNCMSDLNGDTLLAQVLTNVIISNTSEGKGDHFWDNGEANLLKALVLYIDLDRSRSPETKNLAAAYQLLTQNSERQLTALFEKLPLDHPARAPFNLFSQASDTVRSGIVLGLGTRLQVLQNEAVRDIISRSDIDLTAPGKRKCAYFVILSDQDATMAFLSSLFFSFLFIKLVRYADSTPELRCKVPVNLIFDEFNNVGKLGGAADGSDFARTLSVIRSRAIYVMLAVQSLGQLQNRYPNNLWAEIVGNLDVQLMLGCTDEVSAEYFSARSGDMSVEINSTMTVRKTIAVAQVIPQYRQTEGQGRRRLLTPDEVLRIPNEELLVVIRGHNVLKLKKFDYADHPLAKELTPVSILDYTPPHAAAPFLQTETTSPHAASEERPHTSSIPSKRRTLYSSAKPPSEF